MNFVGCIPRFIKAHGGWILTALSLAGFAGTTVLVANAAPEVEKEMQDAKTEKIQNGEEPELTFGEKLEIAAPHYLPAFLTGIFTAGCMVGCQILNSKQQAALIAAYVALGQEFNQYRGEVRARIGEEEENKIYLAAQEKIHELQAEVKRLEGETKPQLYAIATLPGVIFRATPAHMYKVFYHMAWMMLQSGGISLYDLYDHIGIPECLYDMDDAQEFGWDAYENEVSWGNPAVDFEVNDIERKDGEIVHVISTYIQPYKLGLDYGSTDSSCDNLYPGYDYDKTVFVATASIGIEDETLLDERNLRIIHAF